MTITRFAFLPLLAVTLAACGGDTLTAFALKLEIRDAVTGAPAAYDATVIVQQGEWADTLRGHERMAPADREQNPWMGAADGRTGSFDVTVLHPGHETWQRKGIRVRESRGGSPFDGGSLPQTVHVLVELQPASGS